MRDLTSLHKKSTNKKHHHIKTVEHQFNVGYFIKQVNPLTFEALNIFHINPGDKRVLFDSKSS